MDGHRVIPADSPEAREMREQAARYEANGEYLQKRLRDLIGQHEGQWVAVFGEQQMVLADSLESLMSQIPRDDPAVELTFLKRPAAMYLF